MWPTFTNIGDAAMTLPAALICATWIATTNLPLACRWVLALVSGMALVGATKILYAGWGISLPAIGFRVISGHTMLSTSVWTVTLTLLVRSWRQPPVLGIIAGLVLGVFTGLARVVDHSHSLSEVASGWLVGTLVAAMFLRTALRAEVSRSSPVGATVILLLVSMLAYGHRAPFQRLIDTHSPAVRSRAATDVARFF